MSTGGSQRRCTYVGCTRPQNSKKFYSIDEATRAGNQDWRPLHGNTLCTNCYKRYTSRGTLERYEPLAAHEKKCCFEGCTRPEISSNFYLIHKGNKAGGQDWSTLEGCVLCDACYSRYKKRGTLSKTDTAETIATLIPAKRCSISTCEKPEKSSRYFTVEQGRTSGGRDWTSLVGKVLCHTCYQRYKIFGTFDKKQAEQAGAIIPAAPGGIAIGGTQPRKCSSQHCARPTQSTQYHTVEPGCKAGGQDWSSVEKQVLCDICYNRFKKHGVLGKLPAMDVASESESKKCSYSKCRKPDGSSHYYTIEEGKTSGGRDWSSLTGQTLCEACHRRFRTTGSLVGGLCAPKLETTQKVCSYAHCAKPKESSRFLMIETDTKAGGQDWGALEGSVLCIACYQFYKKKGTLERPSKPITEAKLGGPPPPAKVGGPAPKPAPVAKAVATAAPSTATATATAKSAPAATPAAATAVATAAPAAASATATAAPASAKVTATAKPATVGKPTTSASASAGRPTLSKSSVPVPPKQKEKENQKEKERERERESE
mmetsp:Transcript_29621/g.71401  ORF Transcript_29621/g.71401 Transcript_29621/m.71401 type:complete len:542 (-) Transcript_29621:159-1784(-)